MARTAIRLAWGVALLLAAPGAARAQRGPEVDGEDLREMVRATERVGTVPASRLAVLSEMERALAAARASAARLDEGAALRALSGASRLAREHLDVPGMSAWLAEVELALALTAAQADLPALFDASLSRAASLDPGRSVHAAEARPDVVARARAAYRAVATAPRGRFEVAADVPGAVVFLDDRRQGALPRTIEAPIGPHVLRVEAAGHRPWARLVEVLEGDRAAVRVALAPTPALLAAARAREAATRGDVAAIPAALAAVSPDASLALRWTAEDGRSVRVACGIGGCGVERLGADDEPRAARDLEASLAWLSRPERAPLPPSTPWWERWELWVGVGAVLLAAGIGVGIALGVAAQSQGPPLTIVFDPSDVD